MTKIDGIFQGGQAVPNKKSQGTGTDLFKNTLDKALGVKEGLQADRASHSTLKEIAPSLMQPIEDAPLAYNQKTSQLLDLFDKYVMDLADPGKSLREVEPLVKQLKAGAEALLATVEKEIPLDSPLRTLAEESAMRANIEYIKFYRGDYI